MNKILNVVAITTIFVLLTELKGNSVENINAISNVKRAFVIASLVQGENKNIVNLTKEMLQKDTANEIEKSAENIVHTESTLQKGNYQEDKDSSPIYDHTGQETKSESGFEESQNEFDSDFSTQEKAWDLINTSLEEIGVDISQLTEKIPEIIERIKKIAGNNAIKKAAYAELLSKISAAKMKDNHNIFGEDILSTKDVRYLFGVYSRVGGQFNEIIFAYNRMTVLRLLHLIELRCKREEIEDLINEIVSNNAL